MLFDLLHTGVKMSCLMCLHTGVNMSCLVYLCTFTSMCQNWHAPGPKLTSQYILFTGEQGEECC